MGRCMTAATCHPARWAMSRGLCAGCYRRWLKAEGRLKPATCHPTKSHYAKGLCSECYKKARPSMSRQAQNQRNKTYRTKHPDKVRAAKRLWYYKSQNSPHNNDVKLRQWSLTRYGLRPSDVGAAIRAQGGRCPICHASKRLIVDHDHVTKQFRAMLCRNCNLMIGFAQENPVILASAIAYLAKHKRLEWAS